MAEFTIRPANYDDVDELSLLARNSVEQLSQGYYTPDQIRSAVACITSPDLDLIQDASLFVAVARGKVVGCGGWSSRKKLYTGNAGSADDSERLDPGKDPAKIRAFFISPEMSGKGVGRALYERCAASAREAGFQSLELLATLPGIPFYERLGFESINDEPILLKDGTVIAGRRMAIELL